MDAIPFLYPTKQQRQRRGNLNQLFDDLWVCVKSDKSPWKKIPNGTSEVPHSEKWCSCDQCLLIDYGTSGSQPLRFYCSNLFSASFVTHTLQMYWSGSWLRKICRLAIVHPVATCHPVSTFRGSTGLVVFPRTHAWGTTEKYFDSNVPIFNFFWQSNPFIFTIKILLFILEQQDLSLEKKKQKSCLFRSIQ